RGPRAAPAPARATHAATGAAPPIVAPAQVAHGPAIDIENFRFTQPTLTVPVGTTITWTNRDLDEHTVTAKDRLFSSRGLDPGESFAYQFDAPSTYEYFCALHPYMTGRVIVQ